MANGTRLKSGKVTLNTVQYLHKYTLQMVSDNRIFLSWLYRSVLRNYSGTHEGKIVHEFEGTQSRVSIDRSVGINLHVNTVEPPVSNHPCKVGIGFIICRRPFLVMIRAGSE